ncbi:MAG: transcription antitermination factor NusB [Chlamydiota bacterium]
MEVSLLSSREAAFLAIAQFEQIPIHEALDIQSEQIENLSFAREVAAGTVKRLLTLKYFSKRLAPKLRLNHREKALFFSALYQHVFMDSVPLYAIVDETTTLAKKYFGKKKGSFFHALLRRLEEFVPEVPGRKNAFDLSLRLSYPPYFIKKMLEEYGARVTIDLLEVMNAPSQVMGRFFGGKAPFSLRKVYKNVYDVGNSVRSYANSPEVYLQNATPVFLFDALRQHLSIPPSSVLDLCASPGGKLLLAAEYFPEAHLHANDVSEKKLCRLKENLEKYQVRASVFQQRGELFQSDQKYDLILVDAPCSNSGVYHKRVEARWRFSPTALEELSDLQAEILERAASLLAPGGQLWYMSCSILQEENEETIEFADSLALTCLHQEKVLPNRKGWDGGFACSFIRKPA